YFITCLKTERDVLKTEFEGVFAQSAAVNYPISIPITASLGFWGSAGDHELLFRLDSSTEITTIHKKAIHIEYMPEQFEIDSVLMLKISEPGPVFLECLIDGQFLGRKALYFGKLAQLSFKNEKESSLFIEQSLKEFIEEHRKCNDSILNNRKAILDFYVLCEDCNCVGTKYTFLKEIKAVYWKSYPLSLKLFIATALRSCKGEHSIHIDLVNAATRETSKVTSTHFTSTSDCIVTPILGESIVKIPNPGLYFLNIHVDDEFVGSIILPAENDKPKYSYSLLKEDLSRIQSGELLALLKRAPLKGEKSLK
ncbi:MAG: hypothetical protein KKH49_01410, partial [Candidatus Omnitrophica bacterium]|nr:hypothetical protein [Candidatus Omnitrophota bacterium]